MLITAPLLLMTVSLKEKSEPGPHRSLLIMQNDIWARRLLVAGMISGLVLATVGLLRSGESTSPSQTSDPPVGTIALVNGYPIATELYARVLGGFTAERKD